MFTRLRITDIELKALAEIFCVEALDLDLI
jgi:hypothetical protein